MIDQLRVNGNIAASNERRRTRTRRRIQSAVSLHAEGLSNRVIAERLGVSEESVCHYLRAAGIPGRRAGRYPPGFRLEVHAA